jgi:hypothetical protein
MRRREFSDRLHALVVGPVDWVLAMKLGPKPAFGKRLLRQLMARSIMSPDLIKGPILPASPESSAKVLFLRTHSLIGLMILYPRGIRITDLGT